MTFHATCNKAVRGDDGELTPCALDTADGALFAAHMHDVHAKDVRETTARRSYYRTGIRVGKPYPWKAPRQKAYEPKPTDPGVGISWEQDGEMRGGQIWSTAGTRAVWAVPGDRREGELLVRLSVDGDRVTYLDTCGGRYCASINHGCARRRWAGAFAA